MAGKKHPDTHLLNIEEIYKEGIHSVYHDEPVEIVCASYEDNLCVGRHKDAIQKNNSEVLYVVTKNYSVSYRYRDSNGTESDRTIVVPAGLCTDLASVPDCFRWLYPRVGRYLEAAIVHDFLYVAWQLFAGGKPSPHYRDFADSLFLVLLRKAGVNFFTCKVLYAAVRSSVAERAFKGWEKPSELSYKGNICSSTTKPATVPITVPINVIYPLSAIKISNATYTSNLCLGRFKESMKCDYSESLYVVASDYKVGYTYLNGKGGKATGSLTVPAGFCTALTSVPRWRRRLFHRVGKHLEAAIVHDFLYVAWQLKKGVRAENHYRTFANDLFLQLMKTAKVDQEIRARFKSVVNSRACIRKFSRPRKNGDILVDNPCASKAKTGNKN